jgi:hypothetical protein
MKCKQNKIEKKNNGFMISFFLWFQNSFRKREKKKTTSLLFVIFSSSNTTTITSCREVMVEGKEKWKNLTDIDHLSLSQMKMTPHITITPFVCCCVWSQEDLEEKRRPKVVFFVLFCLLWLKEIKQWRWEKKSDEYKVEE